MNNFLKYLSLYAVCLLVDHTSIHAQLLTWSPAFPKGTDGIKIILDASMGNKGLKDFRENVYVHIGLITSASRNSGDWKYVPFSWGSTTAAALTTSLGNNIWQYNISNIRTFFNVPATETITAIAILFRQGNCSNCAAQRNADGTDMYIPIYDDALHVRFEKPVFQPLFVPATEVIKLKVGDSLPIKFIANQQSIMELYLNQNKLKSVSNQDSIVHTIYFVEPGNYTVSGIAMNGPVSKKDSFSFVVAGTTNTKPLPLGMRPGINRMPGDTALTFVLIAPGKTRISILGDFPRNDWQDKIQYQMNLAPDQKTWWITVNGLKPNTEYSFQYLVDGSTKLTDPYVEKILDPNHDAEVRNNTYPDLKEYPEGRTTGIVGVINTSADEYKWKSNFKRHASEHLVVYEVLLRDFVAKHDFKSLKDTLPYLVKLGINAIELMPVNEFEGNLSWGYNPNFYFALDKYYGTETSFKEFVDACHTQGIAVILDIVLNHATGTCPLAALYWDGTNQRPAADNPWFNTTARHPFNVFNDFNHESKETQYFSARVLEFWLKEYRIDGFRFDLSKGFTQKNNPNDVNAWSAYDADRIALLNQYKDSIQKYSTGAYSILEHFADNVEEKTLSDKGHLLWGNSNHTFNEATMGWIANSNFENALFSARSWTTPGIVSYMESHDEERLMYKNIQFGNSRGTYNTKNISTAIERMKMAASFFFMMPGPKMIWQFGELGYDYSINHCVNGSVNDNCRLDAKPIKWEYTQDPARKSLYDWYSKLLHIRKSDLWITAPKQVSYNFNGPFKWMAYNSNSILNMLVVGNFDVTSTTAILQFPKTGTWYDLIDGKTITVTSTTFSMTMQPGEYHVYSDKSFNQITPIKNNTQTNFNAKIFPNPSSSIATLEIVFHQKMKSKAELYSVEGKRIKTFFDFVSTANTFQWPLPKDIERGMYLIKISNERSSHTMKWIKE